MRQSDKKQQRRSQGRAELCDLCGRESQRLYRVQVELPVFQRASERDICGRCKRLYRNWLAPLKKKRRIPNINPYKED